MSAGAVHFNTADSKFKAFLGGPITNIVSPVFDTSIICPLIIGGVTTTSPLTLRATSGIGAAGSDIIFQVGNNGATEAFRITQAAKMLAGNPTSPLGGDFTFTFASQTGQTVGRFESKTTGAAQGAFISIQANTAGVFESGVSIGNFAGRYVVLTNNVTRQVISKTDYFMVLGEDLTNAYPALKRSGSTFEIRLGDDTGYSNLKLAILTATQDVIAGTNNYFYWTSKSTMQSPTDGNILIANNGVSDFGRLQFGGSTASFPSLKRSTITLQCRLADDSTFAAFSCLDIFTNNANFMHRSSVALNNGAAANTGTLTNAPAVGNPTKWIPIDDNGTTRYIPAW